MDEKNIAELNGLPRDPDYDCIYNRFNNLLFVDPGKHGVGDQQGRDTMGPAPERLAGQFRIFQAQLAGGNAIEYATAEKVECLKSGGIRTGVFLLIKVIGHGHHESRPIMMWVFQAEMNIRDQASPEPLERVAGLFKDDA